VLPRFALEAELAAGSVKLVRPTPPLPRLALRRHRREDEASPLARALLAELGASPLGTS
jgi:hypothetical protein